MTDKTPTKEGRVALVPEWAIPGASLLFAIYYLYSINDLPWEAQMLGLFLGAMILVLIAVFAVQTILRVRRRGARVGLGVLTGSPTLARQRGGLVLLCIGYVLVVPYLGFTLTTLVFLLAGMVHLGVRSVRSLALVPTILAAAGYLLFIVALNSRLPYGVIENLMTPVIRDIF